MFKLMADDFVERHFKTAYVKRPPKNAGFNYIVDFRTELLAPYLRFIAKYACLGPNAMSPFFDHAFARLGYFRRDNWNLWGRRHNDEWIVIDRRLTIKECFDRMREDPWFQF